MLAATPPSPPGASTPLTPPGRPVGPSEGATSSVAGRGGWGGRPPPLHEDDDDGIRPIVRGGGESTTGAVAAAAATGVGGSGGPVYSATPHHRRCYTLDDDEELEDEDAIGPAPPSDQLPPGAGVGGSAFASSPALHADPADWERLAIEAADRQLALELHRSLNEGESGSAGSPSAASAATPPPLQTSRPASSLSMSSLPPSLSSPAAGTTPQRLRRQSPGEVAQEAADAALAARVQSRLTAAAGSLRLPPRLRHTERSRLLAALRATVVPGIRAALSRGAVLPPRASSIAVVGGYTLSALSVLHLTLTDASVSLHPLAEGAVLRISPIAMDVEVGTWAVDGRAGGFLGAVGSGMGGSAVVGVSDISLVAKIVAARGEHGHVTGGVTVADCVVEGVGAEVYSLFIRGGGMFSGACVRPMLWSGVTAVATAALREALSVQVRGVNLLSDAQAAGATNGRPPTVPASPGGGGAASREAAAATAASSFGAGLSAPASGRSVSSLDAFLAPSVGATAGPSRLVSVTPPPPAARRVSDGPPAGSQASLNDAVRAALENGKGTGPDRNTDDEVDDASGLLSRVSTW
ncbi:hypothetical protein I4F81_001065 [Pyropia yezoensis]|uniref:Uncharacterized protein n=1 Tax=Pyropia yezoensis TaxID=2788 RepID=A0ACC3BKJ4_PYRYE|nr:hypothetical protein I4F81_001065 [Neopyropia yezoensis]